MARKMIRILAVSVVMAGPAAAQELNFDIADTQMCLEAGRDIPDFDANDCVGVSAQACMETTPGGFSTAAMVGCIAEELDFWDAQLNHHYREARAQAREMDAENGAYAPSQEEALRDMQRAWIAFRDAKCGYARSQWGGGTGAGPAGVSCLLHETADQARYLLNSKIN